jgi:hypothetical protein
MKSSGFGQYSYIGPFCHPQLQSSSGDPKDYSSTVWGGGQNFPAQAFPWPWYYYDKYRALAMAVGQSWKDPDCAASDGQNSLGWTTNPKSGSSSSSSSSGSTGSDTDTRSSSSASKTCAVVPGCEHTAEHLAAAYAGSGTHVDMGKLSANDLACMNYLAYTAIDHARTVCTHVHDKTPSHNVPLIKKTGQQKPIPSDYVNGAPPSWWASEAAGYCPKESVCLPGPKTPIVSNDAYSGQVQFVMERGGAEEFEAEMDYDVNSTDYTADECQSGAETVSVYDIATVWYATFPTSSIDTCAAALISTQGECVTGQLEPTPRRAGRPYPGQPSVCSTAGGFSGGGIWQVTTPQGLIPKSCEIIVSGGGGKAVRMVNNTNLCCSAASTVPHLISTAKTTDWSSPNGWESGMCMQTKSAPAKPGSSCPTGFKCTDNWECEGAVAGTCGGNKMNCCPVV